MLHAPFFQVWVGGLNVSCTKSPVFKCEITPVWPIIWNDCDHSPRIPSLPGVFKLMTTFTAITGSLKFTQPGGHTGDEFHPFPLFYRGFWDCRWSPGALHCPSEAFLSPIYSIIFSVSLLHNQPFRCYFDCIVFHINNRGWFRNKCCLRHSKNEKMPMTVKKQTFIFHKLVLQGTNGTRQHPGRWNLPKHWSIWKG